MNIRQSVNAGCVLLSDTSIFPCIYCTYSVFYFSPTLLFLTFSDFHPIYFRLSQFFDFFHCFFIKRLRYSYQTVCTIHKENITSIPISNPILVQQRFVLNKGQLINMASAIDSQTPLWLNGRLATLSQMTTHKQWIQVGVLTLKQVWSNGDLIPFTFAFTSFQRVHISFY